MKTKKPKIKRRSKLPVQKENRKSTLYASHQGYRKDAQAKSRSHYRKKQEGFELLNRSRSLNWLDDDADHRLVLYPSGVEQQEPVYTQQKLASYLDISYQTLWRWIGAGMAPEPVLKTADAGRSLKVYHREEVRALVTIIAEHLRLISYYRKDHTETMAKVEEQIELIRTQWKDETHGTTQPRKTRRKVSAGKRSGN